MAIDEAAAVARAEGRLLLVDFTAGWCSPCAHMDLTTWRDERVEGWVRVNAVAVQVDVDRDDETAKRFGIKAMPTVVLLRDGVELDRVTGGRPAEKVLEWLDDARRGRTELDRLREASKDDLHGRLHLARVLLLRGQPDEAVDHLVWLWKNCLTQEPGWLGVKHSFLAGVMGDAAQASEQAQARLEALRNEGAADFAGTDDCERFHDWCTLNRVLGNEARTLAWFESVKASPPPGLDLDQDPTVLTLLRAHGRWADLGTLLTRPLVNLERAFGIVRDTEAMVASEQQNDDDREFREHLLESTRGMFREEAADLLRALTAAGRTADAATLREQAAKLEPSPQMAEALDAAAG